MHAYPAYTVESILRLTVRNYMAMRQHVVRLRNRDIADATRAGAYAQSTNAAKIANEYDPPKQR
jgi:hypothetical protein